MSKLKDIFFSLYPQRPCEWPQKSWLTPAGNEVSLQLVKHEGREAGRKTDGKRPWKNMNMYCCGSCTLDWTGWDDLEGTVRREGDTVMDSGLFLSLFLLYSHSSVWAASKLLWILYRRHAPECGPTHSRYSWIFVHVRAAPQSSLLWWRSLQSALKAIYITPKLGQDK